MNPAPPATLRSKAEATRLLILAQLATRRPATLRELAAPVEITAQGASEHLKRLAEEGLVVERDGLPTPTQAGIQWLHARLRELRDFVSEAYDRLRIIDTTTAEAGASVAEGDPVGLFMERGRLVAYPRRDSPSTGRALRAARAGEDLPVGGLEGVISLRPAPLTVLLLPAGRDGGSRGVDAATLRQRIASEGDALVAQFGPVAAAALRKAGLTPAIAHAPVEGAAEACLRGQRVLLLASADEEQDVHDGLASVLRRLGAVPARIQRW